MGPEQPPSAHPNTAKAAEDRAIREALQEAILLSGEEPKLTKKERILFLTHELKKVMRMAQDQVGRGGSSFPDTLAWFKKAYTRGRWSRLLRQERAYTDRAIAALGLSENAKLEEGWHTYAKRWEPIRDAMLGATKEWDTQAAALGTLQSLIDSANAMELPPTDNMRFGREAILKHFLTAAKNIAEVRTLLTSFNQKVTGAEQAVDPEVIHTIAERFAALRHEVSVLDGTLNNFKREYDRTIRQLPKQERSTFLKFGAADTPSGELLKKMQSLRDLARLSIRPKILSQYQRTLKHLSKFYSNGTTAREIGSARVDRQNEVSATLTDVNALFKRLTNLQAYAQKRKTRRALIGTPFGEALETLLKDHPLPESVKKEMTDVLTYLSTRDAQPLYTEASHQAVLNTVRGFKGGYRKFRNALQKAEEKEWYQRTGSVMRAPTPSTVN